MKTIKFIPLFLLLIMGSSIEAQQIKSSYYPDQVIYCGDSVSIELNDYYGNIQWQKSKNLSKWEDIKDSQNKIIQFVVTDSSLYYRAEITSGNCDAVYSDTILISPYNSYNTAEGIIGYGGGEIIITGPSDSMVGTSLIIPEGALENDTLIKFSLSTNNYHFFNDTNNIAISFQPDGLHYNKKVEVTIPYYGVNFDSVVIYYYDPITPKIEIINPTSIDSVNRFISFNTDHFSNYKACKNYQSYPYKQEYSLNNDINRYDASLQFPQYTYLMTPGGWLGWIYDYSNYKRNLGLAPIGYPHILFGKNPCSSAKSTTKKLPCELNKILELYATFDAEFYYEKYPRDLDLVFDIWLTNSENPNTSNITGEIMIWDYKGDITLPNSKIKVATLSIDGIGYELWRYNHDDFPGCEVYNFLPIYDNTNTRNRKVDIIKFINVLKANNQIQNDQIFLSSITFGNEIWYGTGYSVINDYSITIEIKPNLSYGTLNDIDGNSYKTIQIGDQTWMAENLKTTHYSDGSEIPLITDDTEWAMLGDNNNDKGYCFYNNNSNHEGDIYGALYTWSAAMNGKASSSTNPSMINGVCPTGWHLPSYSEWYQLLNYISLNGYPSNRGIALKSSTGWLNGGNGTDNFHFTGLPGGRRANAITTNSFFAVGLNGGWWCSLESSASNISYHFYLDSEFSEMYYDIMYKSAGLSVRCLKD